MKQPIDMRTPIARTVAALRGAPVARWRNTVFYGRALCLFIAAVVGYMTVGRTLINERITDTGPHLLAMMGFILLLSALAGLAWGWDGERAGKGTKERF